MSDLVDHQRGPGFFTAVAASCILGSRLVLISANYPVAPLLWFLRIALWVLLTYAILAAFTIRVHVFPALTRRSHTALRINMGAMAISTLAGARLIVNAPDAPFLHSLLPFLKGFTVFYWATGTWWIPMLAILAAWRYIFKRFPLHYDPLYWGAVFPLGMYAACTYQMAHAMQLDFLLPLPQIFVYLALSAWVLTFTGLCRTIVVHLFGFVSKRPTTSPQGD